MVNNVALKLLHVEDSDEDAYIVKKSLHDNKNDFYSYDITLAQNLKKALKQLEQKQDYNVVLLDLNLPDGKGIKIKKLVAGARKHRYLTLPLFKINI